MPKATWPLSGRDFNAGTTAIRLPSPRSDDRSRQLRRRTEQAGGLLLVPMDQVPVRFIGSGMFIAREPKSRPPQAPAGEWRLDNA